jgi:hypothetical protein
LARPAAFFIDVLMVGAIAMHFKVIDPWKRFLPALSVLILCVVVTVL